MAPVSSQAPLDGSRPTGTTVEEKVYVAVGRELMEGKATLLWALHNISREQKIILTHVHRPAKMIPTNSGGIKFPAGILRKKEVKPYRQLERERMHKTLDEYLIICSQLKVRAEQVVIQMDDVGKGLVELIARFGITKLVMGAAADKHYSEEIEVPKSKTAIHLKQRADPSCKIWFVCKGHLICTREACLDASGLAQSPMARPSSISTQSEQLKLRSLSQAQGESLNWPSNPMQDLPRHNSRFDDSHGGVMAAQPPAGTVKTSILQGRFSTEGSVVDPWGARRTYQSLDHSLQSVSEDALSSSLSLSIPEDKKSEAESVTLPSVQKSDDLEFSSPDNELEVVIVDAEIYHKLQQALTEAESLKYEAYQESCRRQKAERDAVDAIRKASAEENLYAKAVRQRKEIEKTLARERLQMEMLKNQRDEVLEQLQKANERKSALQLQVADSDNIIKDIEDKLSEARYLLNSVQVEHEELQQERDYTVREAEELRHKKKQVIAGTHGAINSSKFSYLELEQATQGFSISLKIGEGNYGSVYKGFLRNTKVAIKILNPQSQQGRSEFHQEVDVLSRVRHPNLVALIGACSEAWALIYEFLPNGSLEDRLACKDSTLPLTWQVRTRIAAEICSTLIFLHSHRPHPVVHGDLNPDNILLDANFMSKLGDFGICRLIAQSNTTTLFRYTHPKGTFAYMDPEFLTTGELTPHSDVYSLGIIILRLLTGRPAFGIVKEMQEAVDKGYLDDMLDVSTRGWPFAQAKQLAYLGLRCCEINRKNRPDLAREVWPVLEGMWKSTLLMPSLSSGSISDDNSRVPNYFICPIFQEIMRDPHIAADGFTYEAEALKGWFDSGHDTSPMTNLKLPHCNLVPNRALHSVIQEWMWQ